MHATRQVRQSANGDGKIGCSVPLANGDPSIDRERLVGALWLPRRILMLRRSPCETRPSRQTAGEYAVQCITMRRGDSLTSECERGADVRCQASRLSASQTGPTVFLHRCTWPRTAT